MNYYLKRILVHCIILEFIVCYLWCYKSFLHPKYPNYIKRLFKTRTSKCMLRGQNLYIGVNKTKNDQVWIGVHYYLAAKSWNLLTGDLTTIMDINKFKTAVRKLDF